MAEPLRQVDSSRRPARNEVGLIEVRVRNVRQLFNSMDPSPFHEKDLDPEAERFIVGWAREMPRDLPLKIALYVAEESSEPDIEQSVRDALRNFFGYEADAERRTWRELMRRGWRSLVIGLVFLTICILVGLQFQKLVGEESTLGLVVREGLLIGGWVAMWRPMQIFLYDWWPIRSDLRLFRKLAQTPVEVQVGSAEPSRQATSSVLPGASTN